MVNSVDDSVPAVATAGADREVIAGTSGIINVNKVSAAAERRDATAVLAEGTSVTIERNVGRVNSANGNCRSFVYFQSITSQLLQNQEVRQPPQ